MFKVNEKVLCYEPDIKKAQVLYDSKVSVIVFCLKKFKIKLSFTMFKKNMYRFWKWSVGKILQKFITSIKYIFKCVKSIYTNSSHVCFKLVYFFI